MDKRFAKVQSLVRGLDSCGSWIIFPHVFLDYDKWQRLPYTWEEGVPTKLAAVCEAEKLLRPLYRQAEQSALLSPEQVFQDMEQVHAELTAAYPLPELIHYFGHIEYIRYDPSEWEEGFLKLVSKAFIRHGYNILPAISQIEENAGSQLAAFQKAFDIQAAISISKHITAPVQAKLPILRELLERGAN